MPGTVLYLALWIFVALDSRGPLLVGRLYGVRAPMLVMEIFTWARLPMVQTVGPEAWTSPS